MTRRGLDALPPAPRGWVARINKCGFETIEQAQRDDLDRAKRLKRSLGDPLVCSLHGAVLARRLEKPAPSRSLASRVQLRPFRANVSYALAKLYEDPDLPVPRFVTIMPETWEIPADELDNLDARVLMHSRFRSLIQRRLPKNPSGYLFAFFDIEYAPQPSRWRPHIHMIAAGDYLQAATALRKCRSVIRRANASNCEKRRVPVRVQTISREKPERLLTYLVKSAWFRVEVVVDGKLCRMPKMAIPDPYHARLLIWMDQFRIGDLAVIMGLHNSNTHFKINK